MLAFLIKDSCFGLIAIILTYPFRYFQRRTGRRAKGTSALFPSKPDTETCSSLFGSLVDDLNPSGHPIRPDPTPEELEQIRVNRLRERENNPHYLKPGPASKSTTDEIKIGNTRKSSVPLLPQDDSPLHKIESSNLRANATAPIFSEPHNDLPGFAQSTQLASKVEREMKRLDQRRRRGQKSNSFSAWHMCHSCS
ncbi:unnamed protein product [Protopolystoma xenopodis]|uniref:Uncharacterized protein n=1 Tax=Protopolystoma xenopodis TaxID=117903 RepID=A0A3S4ZDX2_9PLAT|nr:unnamed protein product [Protopolystoma xenopodis]